MFQNQGISAIPTNAIYKLDIRNIGHPMDDIMQIARNYNLPTVSPNQKAVPLIDYAREDCIGSKTHVINSKHDLIRISYPIILFYILDKYEANVKLNIITSDFSALQ